MDADLPRPTFRLTIAGLNERVPLSLGPDAPDALIWLSPVDGSVWAYGDTVNGDHWLRIPGVASYRFGGAADEPGEATAIPEPGADETEVDEAYRRAVLPMALHVHGIEVLHASAVVGPTGVVAFCAQSHGGKSTIAYACERSGNAVWADDAVAFRRAGDSAEVVPLPFTLRLRAATRSFFEAAAEAPHDGVRGHDVQGDSLPFAAAFVLDRADPDGEEVVVERLPSARAFTAVFEHAYWFDLRNVEQRRETTERYLELVARVPVYRLRYASGFDRLPAVVEAIERTLADPP